VAEKKRLSDQVGVLHLPIMLDQRAKELNLGLAPATPFQVVHLTETPVAPEKNSSRQFARRPVNELAP
jgi:hypothetical protein